MRSPKALLLVGISILVPGVFTPAVALAQEAAPQAEEQGAAPQAEEGSSNALMGDIVVTAQKRSENVQNVPVAISAFSSDSLAARGISNPEQLQQSVPGLVYSGSVTGSGLVTLRGVGGSALRGSTPGRNPAVPVHANGVYLQSPSVMLQDFLDIERVEVLRGPQGTLYGRNAVGGSINVISKRPTNDFSGEVGVEIGNYDKRRVFGVLSGPISDRLRARVAFAMEDRDGYVKDVNDPGNNKLLNSNYSNLRATLEYDLADDVLVSLVGYYYKNDGANFVNRPRSFPAANLGGFGLFDGVPAGYRVATFDDVRKVQQDTRGDGFDETKGVTGTIEWKMGGVTLRSITGYFDLNTGVTYDEDGTDLASLKSYAFFESKYKTTSQEFQLSSDNSSALKWLLGAYYYHEKSSYEGGVFVDGGPNPFEVDLTTPGVVRAESYAAFGQLDWEVANGLTLTGGLRYTLDKMAVDRSVGFSVVNSPAFDFSFSHVMDNDKWSKVTWKLGANYKLGADAMAYASYSRGYKSGGFNLQDSAPAFKPEILDAYEVGVKSKLFDRRLQLNASGYYYDYTDKQESVADAQGFSAFQNAGAATLYGIELEAIAEPVDGLTFDGSVSWLHSRYDSFQTADPENLGAGVVDLKGNRLTEAPEWQLHGGVQYMISLGSAGTLTPRIDHSWTSNKYARPFNLATDLIPSYHRTNASLTWESADGDWTGQLYVENLENNDVLSSFSDTSPFLNYQHLEVFLPPRTYGIKLSHRF
jgi:iron complex outermembrane receptor protein